MPPVLVFVVVAAMTVLLQQHCRMLLWRLKPQMTCLLLHDLLT